MQYVRLQSQPMCDIWSQYCNIYICARLYTTDISNAQVTIKTAFGKDALSIRGKNFIFGGVKV